MLSTTARRHLSNAEMVVGERWSEFDWPFTLKVSFGSLCSVRSHSRLMRVSSGPRPIARKRAASWAADF